MLNAVVEIVTADLGQSVTLEPQLISIQPPFAAVSASLYADDGSNIDFSGIPRYSGAGESGAFDPQVLALLQRTDSGWRVLEYEVGSTDYPGHVWAREHGAPEDIFEQK